MDCWAYDTKRIAAFCEKERSLFLDYIFNEIGKKYSIMK